MSNLAEYMRKTKGPYDGKLKARVWAVIDDDSVALFSSDEKAEAYARAGKCLDPNCRCHTEKKVTMLEVDAKAEPSRFLMPVDEGGAD